MSITEQRRKAETLQERNQNVIQALYKAHGLSRGLDFMTEATTPEDTESTLGISTFINAVGEVNNAVYEALMVALNEAETLQRELPKETAS